jgi:hypothetical protein
MAMPEMPSSSAASSRACGRAPSIGQDNSIAQIGMV